MVRSKTIRPDHMGYLPPLEMYRMCTVFQFVVIGLSRSNQPNIEAMWRDVDVCSMPSLRSRRCDMRVKDLP